MSNRERMLENCKLTVHILSAKEVSTAELVK